ncbi:beta-taxilin isoform X1 [Embiotoca jacksoni]|uniref:beta-taxilin isoform X1 n=1 Tax=Embiotoca jacksoni TaxID=100190 RepID=UPI003703F8DB
METSVKAEVLVPPQPDEASSSPDPDGSEGDAAACNSSFNHMEEFSRRLEDIIRTHGSVAGLLDKQIVEEAEMELMMQEAKDDITAATETEVSSIMQSLNKLSSPEEKLKDLVRKYTELAASQRCDEQRISILMEQRRGSVAARSKLETLCRDLQSHYNVLREETLRRCTEDEEKRTQITSHFQEMLTEIQTQIEQHSTRNDKLCLENSNLTDKLEGLMSQCERREEGLEKINKHRDLQHKLTEAKLQQSNALLTEAEERHKREKEYLLVQAAEWKLQAQTLREQATVMQAQLTLYAQKFDEFQETLSKSNEIYVRFKKEMDNMSDKMKKVEKESTLWRTRFENCNKALNDMMEERAEKCREYDTFVLKIAKLEKLCRTLQDERTVLYDKIKDVRLANSNVNSKFSGCSEPEDKPDAEGANKSAVMTPEDLQDLQELQQQDPVLSEGMSRLKEEQAKLQDFAASLFSTPADKDEKEDNEADLEEDLVASAFDNFKTKPEVQKDQVSAPERVEDVKSDHPELKVEEVQNQTVPTPGAPTPEETPAEPNLKVQTPVLVVELQQVKEEIQQLPAAPGPTPEPEGAKVDPLTESVKVEVKPAVPVEVQKVQHQPAEPVPTPEPEGAKLDPLTESVKVKVKPAVPVEVQKVQHQPAEPVPTPEPEGAKLDPPTESTTVEVKPAVPVEVQKVQQQPAEPVEASKSSESTPPSENTSKTAASSDTADSKKQALKKKKKRNGKSTS